VQSFFGFITLNRPYYRCAPDHASQWPWDRKLGLGKHRVTPAAEEAIALAGLLTSFGRASQVTLQKLTGLKVSESTVQRITEDVGEELAELQAAKQTFGPAEAWSWQHDAEHHTCGYASVDFVSVPQQGPQGAKAESKMAAVALIYNPQSKHDEPLARNAHKTRYLSGFYQLDALGLELRRQAGQVGWDDLQQQLFISDAGAGLEDFARKNFPLAECMVDFYHASEHVASLSRAMHPGDATKQQSQTQSWCHTLKHAGGATLLELIEQLDTSDWNSERRETYRLELGYFRNHHHKMDYERFRSHGWQIGSGAVESTCKRVVTQRLKGAGMRWSVRGSNTMCHLQALLLSESNQWNYFWADHRQNPHLLL
jgi:hypothetical protein